MNTAPWIKLGAVVLVVSVAALGYRQVYALPRASLLDQIESARKNAKAIEKDLRGEFDTAARLRSAGESTLGSKFDAVSARFRDGLARIAESQQLANVTVDHGEPQAALSPLLSVRGVQSSLKTGLRKPADFGVLRGNLKGVGTLDQVLRTLDLAQAQPWLHRVEGFTIKPANKDRDRFELRLEVATLYAPELSTGTVPEPSLAAAPAGRSMMRDAILSKVAFRRPGAVMPVPAPVAVASPPDTPTPPPAQRFAPYEDWRLVGVLRGGHGQEAFFLNIKTGERTTVQQGGALLDAVFVGGEAGRAIIDIGGTRFEVTNGETLAARKPLG